MSTAATDPVLPGRRPTLVLCIGLGVVLGACLLLVFADGLANMTARWTYEEYNHAYLIPFVAVYLLWLRARDLSALDPRGSWAGLAIVLFGLFLQVLGEMSAVYEIAQYGFVVAIWGIAVAAAGLRGLTVLWVPLVYLLFMVPLANFLETRLTAGLQLLSSEIGVAVIRLVGVPVFLEGNVIDLTDYRLQVAEACSGMRYLFPLTSFGFLCAVLFRGRTWQKVTLFLSTVPITILMNSFRIGVIGVLVHYFGNEQAEGFLHDFEGWVVFMACVGVLFVEIWIFARMEKQGLLEIFGLDIPPLSDLTHLFGRARPNAQVLTVTGILLVAAVASLLVTRPPTLVPIRAPLNTLPLKIGDWKGTVEYVDKVYIDALRVADHSMTSFERPADGSSVAMWIAYYDSQVQGAAVHSPQACLPGGGWRIESLEEHGIPGVLPDGSPLRVNRVLIALGEERQLVYYWFAQRGRNITNEFLVKWFIFWDALTMNRTDGALVRVATYVGETPNIPVADQRLEDFIRSADPTLNYFLPGASAPTYPAAP